MNGPKESEKTPAARKAEQDFFSKIVGQQADKLAEQGPAALNKHPRGPRQQRRGRYTKTRVMRRAHKEHTKEQRRAFTKDQERKAKRRFEVAVGLRKNTAPPKPADPEIAAMFSSKPIINQEGA